MSDFWLTKITKIGVMFVTLSITVSCSMQGQEQTKNQLEELQGQILVWIEMSTKSDKNPKDTDKIAFEDSIEEFKGLYPQVQIFVRYFSPEESIELFELHAKRGDGPDMLLAHSSYQIVQLIKNKELRAIDEFEINYSQFSDETIKQVRYKDKTYGLPMYLSTQLLCYNKDKVKQTPKTLQKLIEQARKGYSVGLVSSFAETFWGTGIFGGKLFDDSGRFALSEGGGWARWMEWLIEAKNEPNFILSKKREVLQQAFVEGKLAYLTCSSQLIPYFIETMGPNKLGVSLLPAEANQPATPLLQVGVSFFNSDSTLNQTRLALKLAKFLSNREQQEQTQAAIHFIPSNQNVTLNRQLFPLRAMMQDQAKTAVSISLDDLEQLEVIRKNGNIFYQKMLEGEMTPEQAASKLTQTVNRQ